MKVVNYSVIAGVSILFLIGCLAHLVENDTFSSTIIKKFKQIIYLLMFETILDCVFVLLERYNIPNVVLYLIKCAELTLNPVLILLVFGIFYGKKISKEDEAMKIIQKILTYIVVANGILQVINIFLHNIYYIDVDKAYYRGKLISIYVMLLAIAVVALVFGILRFSSKTQSTMRATIMSFAVILVASIVLRACFPENNYDFLCMSVAVLFLLVYYAHITLRIDPLTKLLNNQVYLRLRERISYDTIIISIDMNEFKQINDQYGHPCGDEVLKHLGKTICKAYGKQAYCFRPGGDEFIVILKPGAFYQILEEAPYHDARLAAKMLMKRLKDLVDERNQSEIDDDKIPLYTVAQGASVYYGADPSDDLRIEEAIELADQRMYRNKRLFKEGRDDDDNVRVLYKRSIELIDDEPSLSLEDSHEE